MIEIREISIHVRDIVLQHKLRITRCNLDVCNLDINIVTR